MATNLAPPKVTSGMGFNYEEKVIAYYSTFLLNNRFPFSTKYGTIEKIDMQTKVDGWLLDDMLITMKSTNGYNKICFSIKSNQQFRGCKAPEDFVKLAWEQYLLSDELSFRKDIDGIGLIVSTFPQELYKAIKDLFRKVTTISADKLPKRINTKYFTNDCVRELFYSFKCPLDLSLKYNITEKDIGKFLKSIFLIDFDFEDKDSRKHEEAINNLKDMLSSNNIVEAKNLWARLIQIAAERKEAGFIDYDVLVSNILNDFKLVDYPDHNNDWRILLEYSANNIELIRDKIGNSFSINRDIEFDKLNASVINNNITFLTGLSGTGKTVLSKALAQYCLRENIKTIWLNSEDLKGKSITDFGNALRLNNQISNIFEKLREPIAIIIIDNLDRIYDDVAYRSICQLINTSCNSKDKSKYHILIISQSDELNRIINILFNCNIRINKNNIVELSNPTYIDYNVIWKAHPDIAKYILRSRSNNLLLTPKILDIILRSSTLTSELDNIKDLSEPEIINIIWENEIRKGKYSNERELFLILLSEKRIKLNETQIPIREFNISDLIPLKSLKIDNICNEIDGRISFSHNLFADWATYKQLYNNENNLNNYLDVNKKSPFIIRPLKIYSLKLIDDDPEMKKWFDLFYSFYTNVMLQDIMLDSVFSSSDPIIILENIWLKILKQNSDIFRRLLNRFLFSATIPDPLYLLLYKYNISITESEIASHKRLPNYIYWFPFIKFLHNHLDEILTIDLNHLAKITDLWLRETNIGYDLRKEAAEIAINISEYVLALKFCKVITVIDDELEDLCYRCGLAAINEFPDRVKEFALAASGRINPVNEVKNKINLLNNKDDKYKKLSWNQRLKKNSKDLKNSPPSIAMLMDYKTKAWKDGPKKLSETRFENICLTTDALNPIINTDSKLAIEIILSLLIEVKKQRSSFDIYSIEDHNYSIKKYYEWFPPVYTRGSFYYFLNVNYKYGLELIIRLVNFATERWKGTYKKKAKRIPYLDNLSDSKRKKWFGDSNIFYWHRGNNNAPFAAASALMALEKWLYDNKDNPEIIENTISKIKNDSNSLAFMGVFTTFGKKHTEYFTKSLLYLMINPIIQFWDMQFTYAGENIQMIGWSGRQHSQLIKKIALEWNKLPHRKTQLNNIYCNLFLGNHDFNKKHKMIKKHLNNCAAKYKKQNIDDQLIDFTDKMIAQYDLKNWSLVENSDLKKEYIFNLPEKIHDKLKNVVDKANNNLLLLSVPLKCKQILDGNIILQEREIESFYNNINILLNFKKESNIEEVVVSINDAICGIIAVLFVFHRNWLRNNQYAEKYCTDYLAKLFENPPKLNGYFIRSSVNDFCWFTFCAYSLPILWSENPKSEIIRNMISHLTTIQHYLSISILVNNCFNKINLLKNDFNNLIYFIINVAFLGNYYYRRDNVMYQELLKGTIKKFITGNIKLKSISLFRIPNLYIKNNHKLKKELENVPHKYYYDFNLLGSAFSFISNFDVYNREENKIIEILFKDIYKFSLEMINEDKKHDFNHPEEWEYWFFDNTVLLVIKLAPIEDISYLWKPILDLDNKALHYIQEFIQTLLHNAFTDNNTINIFVKIWCNILDYALIQEKWKYNSDNYRYKNDIDNLWNSLIDIDDVIINLLKSENYLLSETISIYYGKWCENQLKRSKCYYKIIKFLQKHPEEKLLFKLLKLLVDNINNIEDRHKEKKEINDGLNALMHSLWDKDKKYLKDNKSAFDSTISILEYLSQEQHIGAYELLDRIQND